MGGLRIDITPFIDEKMTKLFRKRGFGVEDITLTSSGVIALAEMGYFVPVKTDIEDRSKANVFQKTLVMFQVLWMVLQCVVRAANGLPITLLEIHILVHALCALVMYLCWLKVLLPSSDHISPQGILVLGDIFLTKAGAETARYRLLRDP